VSIPLLRKQRKRKLKAVRFWRKRKQKIPRVWKRKYSTASTSLLLM